MFEYMTVQDAAKLWGISVRRAWLIPQDAQKPADGRYKQNKNEFIADNKENTR